jgi:hypothetical protein
LAGAAPDWVYALLLSKFGELFVREPNNKIGMLRVSSFEYEVVATDQKDFREWLVDSDKMTEWFLAPLVDRLESSGKLLGAGQCYSFVQAIGLGGHLTVENVTTLSVQNHFCGWGKVFHQVGVLPSGTQVIVKPQ